MQERSLPSMATSKEPYPINLLCDIFGTRSKEELYSYLEEHDLSLPSDICTTIDYTIEAIASTRGQQYSEVLKYRYKDHMTYDEISKIYGVTTERIRQIAQKGLRIMRNPERRKFMFTGIHKYVSNLLEENNSLKAVKILPSDSKFDNVKYDMPISNLELTTRSRNVLQRAGLSTVKEVMDCFLDYSILGIKFRNAGPRSITEIANAIGFKYFNYYNYERYEKDNHLPVSEYFKEITSDEYNREQNEYHSYSL